MYHATLNGAVLADRLRPAHTHWTRLRGLLGTRGLAPGEGLWIKPSNQVHMFGMGYPIDVVFLDSAGTVLRTVETLRPGRVSPRVSGAASVLELPAGTVARTGLTAGARVDIAGDACADRASRGDGLRAALTNAALPMLFAVAIAGSLLALLH